ncbi:MAG: hypothetical protein IPK19_39835 [Chloroflexi bacterium]|nr:hypothetical protein [Chloroflexota bacterium]
MKIKTLLLILLLVMTIAPAALAQDAPAEEEIPSARILNEQGGPASITGEVNYTNGFFTLGVAEPMVILEDQAGFIDRDRGFLILQNRRFWARSPRTSTPRPSPTASTCRSNRPAACAMSTRMAKKTPA